MIESKQIVNRNYEGSNLLSWDYFINLEVDGQPLVTRCMFTHIGDKTYHMSVLMNAYDIQPVPYHIEFVIPKLDIPVTKITAIGLYYLTGVLQKDKEIKSAIEYSINNEILVGML